MYLIRMELDTSKRKCAMALSSPSLFHGAIESSFPEVSRKLWRIDKLRGVTYLLLLSDVKPDLSAAAEQFGTERGWQSRNYDELLGSICSGDRRRFRLTANPVITKSAGTGERGTVMAHLTYTQQEKWLYDRAEKYGFSLKEGEFSVTQSEWVMFRKRRDNGRPVSFKETTFEGILTVTDAELFRETLCRGIGREKAYGCGLMTVLRNEA